jgi:phosphatidylglycerophosphatase A
LLALPWRDFAEEGALLWTLLLGLGAFLLFRGFDIVKPPPIRSMQRYRGGWGILVDDLLAGAAALAILQILIQLRWFPALII